LPSHFRRFLNFPILGSQQRIYGRSYIAYVECNESGKGGNTVKLFKLLLSLHSIKLVLISVIAITYIAFTYTKTSTNASDGKAIAILTVPSSSEKSTSGGLTFNENPRSISDVAAVTMRTGQRLRFPLRRTGPISLGQTIRKSNTVINKLRIMKIQPAHDTFSATY
jgi:hypothetical protein